jgi:hypothetical protein
MFGVGRENGDWWFWERWSGIKTIVNKIERERSKN